MNEQLKGIYHSELESVTAHSPVSIILMQAPSSKSRNKDLAGFATITDWNGKERYINIENANVFQALATAPVGVPISIKAWGKGPQAVLQVVGVAGGAVPPAVQPPAPAPHQNGGHQPVAAAPAAVVSPSRTPPLMNLFARCMMAADEIMDRYLEASGTKYVGLTPGERMDAVLRIANGFNISMQADTTRVLRAPPAPLAPAQPAAPPPPPPPAPPPPPPVPAAASGGAPFDPFAPDDDDLPF